MEIKKGDIKYIVSERSDDWKVVAHISDSVGLTYEISKGLCATVDDVAQYVIEHDDIFVGG